MKKKAIIILSIVFFILFSGIFIFYLIKGDTTRWMAALGGMIASPIPALLFFLKNNPFHLLIIFGYYFTLIYSLLLGAIVHLYDRISWWDTSLHVYMGIYLVVVSRTIYRYFMPDNLQRGISRLFIFLFVLSLPTLVSEVWEIFEFVCDQFSTANVMQKGGNKDTMVDIIALTSSDLVAAIYFVFIKRKF